MGKKPKRCRLIVDGVPCNLDAVHRLLDGNVHPVKGMFYCEEHAHQYIAALRRAHHWSWTMEPLEASIDERDKRIAKLEDALRFYADCEWGWNGPGDYEPMIFELPERLPAAFNCKDAGSVARAALKETTDERPE